jgi:hypothetical protein
MAVRLEQGTGDGTRGVSMRLNLPEIARSLQRVENEWPAIDAALRRSGIGRKDPFTAMLRENMLSAYAYLDHLLAESIEPFCDAEIGHMLTLNERVHYGNDRRLITEFARAIEASAKKFYANIEAVQVWHARHARQGDHPNKLAAEAYVSIVGQPQVFIEGNHRTGSLIASWINLHAGYPPFVLSVDNALAYFSSSAEIKQFADRSTWRGRRRLAQYRKSFRTCWEQLVDPKYVLPGPYPGIDSRGLAGSPG